jgi:hypothetical protein
MDVNDRTEEDRALRVELEIHLDRVPICGRLRPESGAEQPFVGWLGFVDTLKRLHDADTREESTK